MYYVKSVNNKKNSTIICILYVNLFQKVTSLFIYALINIILLSNAHTLKFNGNKKLLLSSTDLSQSFHFNWKNSIYLLLLF